MSKLLRVKGCLRVGDGWSEDSFLRDPQFYVIITSQWRPKSLMPNTSLVKWPWLAGGGGNNREKTNIRVRLQKGGKNIPWKLDPSGVKVVCDCIFCFPRLLFRVILVSHNFTIPPIATFCTTLSADEPAVRSNLKIGKHGLFPFTSHLLHYDKI